MRVTYCLNFSILQNDERHKVARRRPRPHLVYDSFRIRIAYEKRLRVSEFTNKYM